VVSSENSIPGDATQYAGIRLKGRDLQVPSLEIDGRIVIATGRWLTTATVRDEAFVQGPIVPDPGRLIEALKQWEEQPDILNFAQKIGEPEAAFGFHREWDDFAVIRVTTYEDWLKNRVKRDVKENLRRARREGVAVRAVAYTDDFVRGIKELYDETPVRQGKRFWHYGKSFDSIKEIHGTYQDRAEYIGAYLGEELIGFVKMVYVDNFAKTMHVISKERHFHKRPTNALIAKAVEICSDRGLSHFIYGEYNFPGKGKNSLTDFKRHHGFEEVRYPRYFVPLTAKGKLALRLNAHRGVQRHMPAAITHFLLNVRSSYYRRVHSVKPSAAGAANRG
jgi:hypothetical protein